MINKNIYFCNRHFMFIKKRKINDKFFIKKQKFFYAIIIVLYVTILAYTRQHEWVQVHACTVIQCHKTPMQSALILHVL